MSAKKRISAFHYQSSPCFISTTAYPFAKPFNREGASMLKLQGKLRNTRYGGALDALIGGPSKELRGVVVSERLLQLLVAVAALARGLRRFPRNRAHGACPDCDYAWWASKNHSFLRHDCNALKC